MNLELKDISVEVPDGPDTLTILKNVRLAVDAGEVVAITGESGSGKSTLTAVAGLLRAPTTGSVWIGGNDSYAVGVSDAARTKVRRSEIGLVFQSANLFPSLTAIEQLELVAHLDGRLDSTARDRAAELLDRVGMTPRANQRPNKLSGGERQRVAFARALMGEPSIILADEPTASLDDSRGREIMALLAESARLSGAATLIITHVPDQLGDCDRMVHLSGGGLVEQPVVTVGAR